jgi:hypothetical protein
MDGMTEKRIYGPSKIVFAVTSGLPETADNVFVFI